MTTNRSYFELRHLGRLFDLGHLGGTSDRELLEWFETHQGKAQAAFEELVDRHGAMVMDVCRHILQNPQDVDDAFQATFLILARRAGTVRGRDILGAWLHRVAVRVALRLKSNEARRRDVERRAVAAESCEEACRDLERSEVLAAVHEELDRLPASYRAALIACHLEGLTHEEAASRLGWPVGTVRSRLSRGRDRLRGRLARRGFAPVVAMAVSAAPTEAASASLQALAVRAMGSRIVGRELAGMVSARVADVAQQVIRGTHLRTLRLCAAFALTMTALTGSAPLWLARAPVPAVALSQAQAVSASLSGVVHDEEGHPVPGATVVAGISDAQPNHRITTTREDGRYSFSWRDGTDRLDYVIAYKEGLAPAVARQTRLVHRLPTPYYEADLLLARPDVFAGKVQDRDGRPIAGARIRLTYVKGPGGPPDLHPIREVVVRGTPLEGLFKAVSDARGDFRFPAVPTPGRIMVEVKRDGYADLVPEGPGALHTPMSVAGSPAAPARLVMDPEARVTGRITTDIPGVRVEGLKIGLQSASRLVPFWREGYCDAEGRFEFRGLPKGEASVFPHDRPSDGPWTCRAANLELRPGETAEATIELIEGCLVEGRVIDVGTRRPVSGGQVGVSSHALASYGRGRIITRTDGDGRYRFRLPSGECLLRAGDDWRGGSSTNMYVTIPEGARTFAAPPLIVGEATAGEPPAALDGSRP